MPDDVAQIPVEQTRTVQPGQQISDSTRDALMKEYQLSQQRHKFERANPNIVDLAGEAGYSALYQGIQSPILSVGQVTDNLLGKADIKSNVAGFVNRLPAPEHEEFGTARWHAQQIGGGAGMMLPFLATKGALTKTGLSFAARTEATVFAGSKLMSTANAGLIADGAITGFAYDFLLRPLDESEKGKFWENRSKHGLTGAATFGTLTAGSVGLRHMTRSMAATIAESPKVARIAYDFTMGALPGIPAGVVSADVDARLTKGRWATGEERAKGAYTMFMAGGTLSAFHSLPGSDVPIGEVARAYASRRAAASNLESMLAERARTAAESKPVEAPGDSKLTGRTDRSGSGAASERATKGDGGPERGRALASTDEGKVAQPVEMELTVPKELAPVLEKGVDLAFKASDPECTPEQVTEFFKFARGEGAPLKGAMMEVAKAYADDPRMMTLIREAYLPPEGVEHRIIDGDIKLKTPGATIDQYQRWANFMQIVREMPQDVDGYVNFRHDVFRWLNENKDLHDWARQYGEQNRYSKVAGPLDYYFGTSNLARFVDVAEGRRGIDESPGSKSRAAVSSVAEQPPIRIDLTADQARRGAADGVVDPLQALGNVDINGIVGNGRTGPEVERVVPETEAAPRTLMRERSITERMEAFEKSPPHRKKIDAMNLSESFGEMSTEQFARWLDYAYAKPQGATTDGASNLRSMWINNRDALLNPEVAEAYKAYRGFGEARTDGKPTVSLESIRQFLSKPAQAQPEPIGDWLKFYIDARLEQARETAKPDAKPHEILNDALPRTLVEGLKAQYVTDAKIAGEPPTYSEALPPELVDAMEAARQSQPPKRETGRPEREFKPPTNDASFRLGKLNEIMAIDDPVIRDNLLRLGAQDHTGLRNVLGKLDPERAAPEYKELLRMVLPKAQNINDVKLLLDTIFFGNKNHRADNGSELTKMHQQLAMATAEHLVPQSDANFDRTQQLVSDFITGKIRDPRPAFGDGPPGRGGPRDGGGRGGRDQGRDGGRGGADPKLTGGDKSAGSASKRAVAVPPRPPEQIVVRDTQPQVRNEGDGSPRIVIDTDTEGGGREQVLPETDQLRSAAGNQPVEGEGSGTRTNVAPPAPTELVPPERTELVPPERTDGGGTSDQRVEQSTDRPAGLDVSTLKHGAKVKVGTDTGIYVGADAQSGDHVVRVGKVTPGKETFYNQKQFGKFKWHQVGQDMGRTIYRDSDGQFYAVREHGSGYMTSELPQYRAVKAEQMSK